MSDAEFLLLLLACFYLGECACWVRVGTLLFSSQLGERLRWSSLRWALLRNPNGGILFGNLLPFGHSFLCQQWPLSLSPEGIYAYAAQAITPDGRPPQSEKYVRYEHVQHIHTEGQQLFINNVPFIKVNTPTFAHYLAKLLKQLTAATSPERATLIAAALEEHVNTDAVRERIALFRRRTAALRLSCLGLLLYVFLLLPVHLGREGGYFLLHLLAGYLGLVFLIALQFRSAHGRLYPEEKGERRKHLLMFCLSPVDVIHARDKIALPLLGMYHPLAVACAATPRDVFEDLAHAVWRDLEYPTWPICPVNDDGPRQTEEWFRQRVQSAVAKLLEKAGLEPAQLAAPPSPQDATCRSYCPRCLGQFVIPQGQCDTCGGRPLLNWD